MATPTATDLVNLLARCDSDGTRIYHDPYVVTATSEDTDRMGHFGLLPSAFRRGLLQITSWPVPVSEPYDQEFDHPDLSLYFS